MDRLGVSRQAIHATINQMVELGIVKLVDDPSNGRVKIVAPTKMGEAMRIDAQRSMIFMAEELGRRLGRPQLMKTAHFLAEDWGPPMTFTPDEVKGH